MMSVVEEVFAVRNESVGRECLSQSGSEAWKSGMFDAGNVDGIRWMSF
jgi:hypothetical protein